MAELEGEVSGRDLRLKETESRAGDNHVRAERLANQIRDLDEELRHQRDRATKLSKLLDDEKRARTKAELELGMVRGKPEIAGAKDRIETLTADLDAARTRVAELELDVTETRRRLTVPPAPHPDAKLIHRLNELELAVNAALHDASDTAAERDAANARAVEAEVKLAAELRDRADADTRAAIAEKRAAESTRRFTEAERHAADEGRRAEVLAVRLTQTERRLADAEHLAAQRNDHVAADEARIAGLQAQLAERDAEAARADRAAADAAAQEIASLESALRERGHVITALTRDLRESERVGKELLSELEGNRSWVGNGDAGHHPGDDLRGRLDTLAASAARTEADLASRHLAHRPARARAGAGPHPEGPAHRRPDRAGAGARRRPRRGCLPATALTARQSSCGSTSSRSGISYSRAYSSTSATLVSATSRE